METKARFSVDESWVINLFESSFVFIGDETKPLEARRNFSENLKRLIKEGRAFAFEDRMEYEEVILVFKPTDELLALLKTAGRG